MDDEGQRPDNPEDGFLIFAILVLIMFLLLGSCKTPAKKDLDCQWIVQNNGQLFEYCRLPRYDKPIGRQGL